MYLTNDRFELQRPPATSREIGDVPKFMRHIVESGIETYLNRITAYASLAGDLQGIDLGDVVEFGGSVPPLTRLLSYRSWNVPPNYPHVDLHDLHAYADQSCDTVVLDNILEHVEHPEKAVAESARVLRPGGRLIAMVPFLVPVHAAPDDFNRWTPKGFEVLLRRAFATVTVGAWGNRLALQLSIELGVPSTWPTFDHACQRFGNAQAWQMLRTTEPEWPIVLWAIAQR